MVLGILCFVVVVVLCFALYWFVVTHSERARAFEGYMSSRARSGGAKKERARREKEHKSYEKKKIRSIKREATINKYKDALHVTNLVCDGYSQGKVTVSVVINRTSYMYVSKILRKEGVRSWMTAGESGTLVELIIKL